MKLVTIIGARPQFIKAAMLSKKISEISEEIIIHTGQHYDTSMSDVFFEELQIPKPKYYLNIGSATHGKQTGRMLEAIENVLLDEKPDGVIVYGDTNSTLAGALAASKIHIPLIHIEAGLRSFNMLMPEEINRIMTDHISNYLFCPSEIAVKNLNNENISLNVYNVGDIMKDAVLYYTKIALSMYDLDNYFRSKMCNDNQIISIRNGYYLGTVHRAENTDNPAKIMSIFEAFSKLDHPVIIPLHPRTKKLINSMNLSTNNIFIIEPVGYLEMLFMQKHCVGVITDSGGVQKEAYILKKPCITLREQTEWLETLEFGWNKLSSIHPDDIVNNVNEMANVSLLNYKELYGDGDTASKIIEIIKREIKK